jgi:uncharacterized membrane protein YjjP (DUF1212 family)
MSRRFIDLFWRSDPRPDPRALAEMRTPDAPDAPPVEHPHRAAFAFIEKLARALHRYGSAAPNIEDALTLVANRLGIRGEFFATPTAIFATLEWQDHEETFLIRVEPGSVNLDKLSRLDRLAHDVADGRLSPADASRMIDEIRATPPRYRGKTSVVASTIGSACSARFFGGGWREVLVCALIGCVTGLLALLARRDERFRFFEPVAAFVAGVIASAATVLLPPTSLFVAMCGGLIILLPGLTLTTAISELATSHLASGTARMMAAMMLFLSIGFGLAVGLKTGGALVGAPVQAQAIALPWWTMAVALVLAPVGFIVLFQAHPRDAGWIIVVCTLAFACARLGAQAMGPAIGAFTGALAVGVASGIHSRWRNRPALVTSTPGILMLVPGSVGLRSITDLLANDPVQGLQTAFTMVLTAVALVTGLLMARFMVPRRRWFK